MATEQEGDFSFAPDIKLNDGDVVQGDGWNVEAVYTPGHISNHLCFAVKEDNALLSGDHVMGWSTAVISPPDGNMADYFASLRKLLPRDETLYIPTHGAEIRNPHPFVEAYIEHRLGREAQIMARLKEGPQTIPQMVAKNYADTPIHLHAAAGRSMLAHLIQMVKDGRVKTEDGRATIDSTYRLLREETNDGPQTHRQDRADHGRQPRHRLCLRDGLRGGRLCRAHRLALEGVARGRA